MNDQIQQIMMYPASRFPLKAIWYLEGFKTATHRSIVNNNVMYTEKNTSWKIKTRLQQKLTEDLTQNSVGWTRNKVTKPHDRACEQENGG